MLQSTHSHGVRHSIFSASLSDIVLQSTHSHGVRPLALLLPFCIFPASIHALTWSATHTAPICPYYIHCFNPRTHMECDRNGIKSWRSIISFNPRTHMECDCGVPCCHRQTCGFNPRTHMECDLGSSALLARISASIHALTWSATRLTLFPDMYLVLQSTHSHGVRPSLSPSSMLTSWLQSTHSHGVRPGYRR